MTPDTSIGDADATAAHSRALQTFSGCICYAGRHVAAIDSFDFGSEEALNVAIPAANGPFTTRSLDKLYAALAEGGESSGVRLLSTIARGPRVAWAGETVAGTWLSISGHATPFTLEADERIQLRVRAWAMRGVSN